VTIQAAEAIGIGQPVIARLSDGQLELARADAYAQAQVLGIAETAALTGFAADVRIIGEVTLADWTAVTGTISLSRGRDYYLDPTTAGRLTLTPPSAGGLFVVRVGRAALADTLDVHVHTSIRKA